MTAIVAWSDGKKNYLAADGRTTAGPFVVTDEYTKIISVSDWHIAASGDCRLSTLIEQETERGGKPDSGSIYDLVSWIRSIIVADDWMPEDGSGVRCFNGVSLMVVGEAGIYDIDGSLSVSRVNAESYRVGCAGSGGVHAAAALYALREAGCRLKPDEEARIALSAASMVEAGCGKMASFVSVDCAAQHVVG